MGRKPYIYNTEMMGFFDDDGCLSGTLEARTLSYIR